MLDLLRLLQTPLLRRLRLLQRSRIPSGRPVDVPLYPSLEGFTAQEPSRTPPGPPRTPQGPPQSAPRCLQNRILAFLSRLCCHLVGQVAARTRTRRQDDVKIAFRCQFEPNLAQLKPILDLTWPHLGPPDLLKTLIFHGFLKVFCYFTDLRLETSKGASRWPRQVPKRPQEGPQSSPKGP